MNTRLQLLTAALLVLITGTASSQDKATKEAADKLHAAATQEPDSGKAAEMLCRAAGMVPKNSDYANECTGAKRAMVDADQRNMQRAIDAADSGKIESAKNYARHVTTLSPQLHEQAQALITKLSTPAAPAAQPAAPAAQPATNQSATQLAQATSDFDNGNLSGARAAAQQVTDAALKPSAAHLLAEIENYTNAVSEGRRHEEAKEYGQAAGSYQAALSLNSHVGSDDLNGRIARMRQMASAPPPAAPAAQPVAPAVVANNAKPNVPPPTKVQAPVLSAQDKQRQAAGFVTEADMAFGRKDYNAAEGKFRQALLLDPQNADAKRGISDTAAAITAQLSHDPALLENTLRDALKAFYASDFDAAQQNLNRYLGAQGGKKKGAAYFYLGATEEAQAILAPESKRASHQTQAKDNFKQARAAGYQPVQKYVSERILEAWQQSGI